MSIGERILQLRKERHLSQLQLAQTINVTRQAVSKWENDLSSPDTIKLIQLADVLNTDVEYLATGKHSEIKESVVTVERIIEKPVVKVVQIERTDAPISRTPTVHKIIRTKYIRRPIEFVIIGLVCFICGLILGLIF